MATLILDTFQFFHLNEISSSFIFDNSSTNGRQDRFDRFEYKNNISGKNIPLVYGTAKITGSVIWINGFKKESYKGGIKKRLSESKSSYAVSVAVAVCSGPVDILRIWIDGDILEQSLYNISVYQGSETQRPDPIISAYYGGDKNCPAFRGLSYVVFQDIDISSFGNKIPEFKFEVSRLIQESNAVENRIKAVVMTLGGGEFGCDTEIQKRYECPDSCTRDWDVMSKPGKILLEEELNQNASVIKSDAMVSLDNLKRVLPKVEWVSVLVNWFSKSLDASKSIVLPGVGDANMITGGNPWRVNWFDRKSAHLISKNEDGFPNHFSSPNDSSLVRYLKELKKRGYKIMLYPVLQIDDEERSSRADMFCTINSVKDFFNKHDGYNQFILHYATLCMNLVDAFIIGSGFTKLTSLYDKDNNKFPVVDAFIDLAQKVRDIMKKNVLLSYAADWREYHSDKKTGIYNMDPLWMDKNIDFVGINAYCPLTDLKQKDNSVYDFSEIADYWRVGEEAQYIYKDEARAVPEYIERDNSRKDVEHWKNNRHYNRDGSTSSWKPAIKDVWFTEYGFPSVDLCTNEPDAAYDPRNHKSRFPRHSNGNIDYYAQRVAIDGTNRAFARSEGMEVLFLKAWDIRPYPAWPLMTDVWGDGDAWATGHWVQGKLGKATLANVVKSLCGICGINSNDIDVDLLMALVDGFVIDQNITIMQFLGTLQTVYGFDMFEGNGKIVFKSRKNTDIIDIPCSNFIDPSGTGRYISPFMEENPKEIDSWNISNFMDISISCKHQAYSGFSLQFFDLNRDYAVSTYSISLGHEVNSSFVKLSTSLVLDKAIASEVLLRMLHNSKLEKFKCIFYLPIRYVYLTPSDIVRFELNGVQYMVKVLSVDVGINKIVRIGAVAENSNLYSGANVISVNLAEEKRKYKAVSTKLGKTYFEALDIPLLPHEIGASSSIDLHISDLKPRLFLVASGVSDLWGGCNVRYSTRDDDDKNSKYKGYTEIKNEAIMGFTITQLPKSDFLLFDYESFVDIILVKGTLQSVRHDDLFEMNYVNLALIGDEIVQFREVELLSKNVYRLRHFVRGLFGSEKIKHETGERFVLIEYAKMAEILLNYNDINKNIVFDVSTVHVNSGVDENTENVVFYKGASLKPLSPVHPAIEFDGDSIKMKWIPRIRGLGFFSDKEPDIDGKIGFELKALFMDTVVESTVLSVNCYNFSKELLAKTREGETIEFHICSVNMHYNIKSDFLKFNFSLSSCTKYMKW